MIIQKLPRTTAKLMEETFHKVFNDNIIKKPLLQEFCSILDTRLTDLLLVYQNINEDLCANDH